MNNKSTYIMLGTALALLGVIAIAQWFDGADANEGFLLASAQKAKLEPDAIDTVEIEFGSPPSEKMVLVREGEKNWKMTEPKPARVESFAVANLVRDLLTAKTDPDPDLTSNLANHGLDKPTVVVTLKKGSDWHESVKLGNVTVGSDKGVVFATTTDNPDVPVAVKRSSLGGLLKANVVAPKSDKAIDYVKRRNDFRTLKLLGTDMPQAAEEAQRLAMTDGKSEVVLQRTGDGEWKFEKPTGMGYADREGGPPAVDQSISGVRPLISNLTSLRAAAADDFIDDASNLAQFGLSVDSPERLKVVLTRKPVGGDATVTETLLIGKPVDEKSTKVFAMIEGDSVVAKVEGGPSLKAVRTLVQDPKSIRDRNLVRLTPTNVDALQIVGAETIELFRSGTPALWKIYDSAGAGQEANQSTIDAILKAITEPSKIINFPPPGTGATLGFDKPQAELSVWVNGIVPEEKKDDKKDSPTKPKLKGEPTVKLVFGRSEGDFVYVRRVVGGETLDAMVPESLVGLLRRKRVEYLDLKLPAFPTPPVAKLTVDRKAVDGRSAVNFVTEREAKEGQPSGWKLLAPESFKGREADPVKVENILRELATLRPMKLIADKASADALSSWGLAADAPVMKVTTEWNAAGDAEKNRVFLFGKPTEDKSGVYAKLEKSDLVFTVPKLLADTVADSDILNMTIYRVDKAKVKKIKLTGWAEIVGAPAVREVEKKGDAWAFVGAVAYPIDPKKVDTFLEDIISPRAEKFVTFKSGPKPEQGLDVNAGALLIELTVDGMKDPVTLMLGKADDVKIDRGAGDGSTLPVYFAQSNQQPGDVFLLLQDRFKAVKSVPAVFKQ